MAASHHERMDGRGCHRGLLAGTLSVAVRALAVPDVCEALTADRPYRAGMPIEQALATMRADGGAALCPESLAALERWLERGAGRRAGCELATAA